MRAKFPLFPNFSEYRMWARRTLFPHEIFLNDPFFSRFIDYVLAHAAPIFYWAENETERLAYLGAYRVIPIVHPNGPYLGPGDRYKDPVICGLTHGHEYGHNLYGYPTSLDDHSAVTFDWKMQEKEHAASNLSEVLFYYLVKGLREVVGDAFFMPGWYDRLIEIGYTDMPKVSQIATWRRQWLLDPPTWEGIWAPGEKYANLAGYMRRFSEGNEDFNHKRMKTLLGIDFFNGQDIPGLEPDSYLSVVQRYRLPAIDPVFEENWRAKQLIHFQLVWGLFGNTGQLKNPTAPQSYAELGARVGELDSLVIDL